jgi:FMN phosphatase YigB (HAD superfamily)
MDIRAILFDLGDIFFEAHYWRKWLYLKSVQKKKFKGSFKEFYNLWENILMDVYKGGKKYNDAILELLNKLNIHEPGYSTYVLNKKVYFENNRKLYRGVKKTLNYLYRNNIYNIVITDNEQSSEIIRQKILKRYKIDKYINYVFTSLDFNLTKDDPLLFQLILKRMKYDASTTLFVGHDKNEIINARVCGIKTILFNNYLQDEINSDYKINNFEDIVDVLKIN